MSIKVPSLPRVFPLPGGKVDVPSLDVSPQGRARLTDEYGLALSVYESYPKPARRLIALALRELGLPTDRSPSVGSIAEIVVFGLLLDHGMSYLPGVLQGSNNFTFQSYEIGGRQPGGAVVDFMVYRSGERIAVRVQSVFHDLVNPFGMGGQVTATDANQKLKLMAAVYIDRLVDVNQPPARVLETSEYSSDYETEWLRIRGIAS